MRVVLDTNVLVSYLLFPNRAHATAVRRLIEDQSHTSAAAVALPQQVSIGAQVERGIDAIHDTECAAGHRGRSRTPAR